MGNTSLYAANETALLCDTAMLLRPSLGRFVVDVHVPTVHDQSEGANLTQIVTNPNSDCPSVRPTG